MLNKKQEEKLKGNWGASAEALACPAEIRLHDLASEWQCYILAMNPEDNDEVICIIQQGADYLATVESCSMKLLDAMYNGDGEGLEIDKAHRPRKAQELFKALNKAVMYDTPRN